MKILIVHNYYSQRGGEDVYVDNLKHLLKKKGHQIIFFSKFSRGLELSKNISAIKSMFGVDDGVKKEFSDLIKSARPDIAHFNNIYPLIGPSAYLICRENRIPIVQTIHNYRLLPDVEESLGYDNYSSRIYKVLFKTAVERIIKKGFLNLVDRFVFPSSTSLKTYKNSARFRIRSYSVIPNFAGVAGKASQTKKSDFFLYAGRFSKEKGIIPLLEVFSRLPNSKIVAIGDGPDKKKALKYKKIPNIKIMDWIDRKSLFQYIRRARALISPSMSQEVMPLGVIEALVLKTRVIVPKTKVFEEIIKDKDDGVYFNNRDFDDLKAKISAFDVNQKVKTDYAKLYSSERHYLDLLKIYKKMKKGI